VTNAQPHADGKEDRQRTAGGYSQTPTAKMVSVEPWCPMKTRDSTLTERRGSKQETETHCDPSGICQPLAVWCPPRESNSRETIAGPELHDSS
jgi:hypothetical protein